MSTLLQHKPSAQWNDYRPDPSNTSLSGTGPGTTVLRLLHLTHVMVSVHITGSVLLLIIIIAARYKCTGYTEDVTEC